MYSGNKKITIKDIAASLNIHHSTVSRALRDHPDVNPQTKERVKAMAEEFNYQPNLFARNLKTNNTQAIGVIVPDIKNFFFANVISGIEEEAHKEGYTLLLTQSNENYEREVINTKALVSNNIAGLIVSISQTTNDGSHFNSLLQQGVHLIFFDRVMNNVNAAKIVVDDYKGAYNATEYLISKGYKKIAHIGGKKDLMITEKRFKGYKDALENNNITFKTDLTYFGGFQKENGIDGAQFLFDSNKKLDAIFAVNDPVALGAYEVIKKRGLKIPGDIAVVGFANNPISAFVDPPLTTIEQPSFEMGKQAAQLLFQQIKNNTYDVIEKTLDTNLIVRSST